MSSLVIRKVAVKYFTKLLTSRARAPLVKGSDEHAGRNGGSVASALLVPQAQEIGNYAIWKYFPKQHPGTLAVRQDLVDLSAICLVDLVNDTYGVIRPCRHLNSFLV